MGGGEISPAHLYQKGNFMDIIEKMLRQLEEKDRHSVYLREIALLMEKIDILKGKLKVKQNLIENLEKQLGGKK